MNLLIIGAGPAGEAAAKKARKISPNGDLNITLVEKEHPGGLCLNKGCIPSKTLLEQVRKKAEAGQPVDWDELQKAKTQVVEGIRSQLKSTLNKEKINLVQGTAKFQSPNSVEVEGGSSTQTLSFDKAIVTAGTEIFYPAPLDKFKNDLLNSDKILELKNAPKSILIVGGGAVGLEFACLLNASGTQVTVLELKEGILPGEDPFVVSTLTRIYESRGIKIITGAAVKTLEKTSSGWKAVTTKDDVIEVEQVSASVGRIPNPNLLSLDKANIKTEKNRFEINQNLQTSNPNVFVAGDVATTRLAHAAAHQAEIAAANALGEKQVYDEGFVPRCLYSWPEVASVGEWKYQREEKNLPVKAARAFYKGSAKALAAGETDGFVQVVSNPETKKILGAQILGAHATELIHIFSVALKANMTTNDLANVMFAHPTLAELVKDACKK